jgi:penicillin amidase
VKSNRLLARFRYALPFSLLCLGVILLSGSKGCPPKDELVLRGEGLTAEVTIYRDEIGIPHIYGADEGDVAFAQGYVQSVDRFFQMDLFRRSATGTIASLMGPGDNNDYLNYDLEQRSMGYRRVAGLIADELRQRAGHDEEAARFLRVLNRFVDGVNSYLSGMINGSNEVPAQYYYLLSHGPRPGDIPPWTIEDILAFGRLQSAELSYETDDIGLSARLDSYSAAFGTLEKPGIIPGRAGLFADLFRFEPIAKVSILGSRASQSSSRQPWSIPAGRHIRDPLLQKKITRLAGQQRDKRDWGSNNWVISGQYTQSGYPILANDPHLGLTVPATFYMMHLNTKDAGGDLNVMGVGFPGVPGVVAGFNDSITWGITTFEADVTDVYLEKITKNPAGDTVAFDNPSDSPDQGVQQIPIETITETIAVRDPETGGIKQESASYRWVPHHGLLLSEGETEGLSVRWTGFEPSSELESFYRMNRAQNLSDFKAALQLFEIGAQNFVYADVAKNIYYAGQARIPQRSSAALSSATPPYLILPGQGQHEWRGYLPPDAIPHLENPARGYIASANNSPDGAAFDNDPINQSPYLGIYHDLGGRADRIAEMIESRQQSGHLVTPADMAAMQADDMSWTGRKLQPRILAAALANPKGLADAPAVKAALERLKNWDFHTPAAIGTDKARTESLDPAVRSDSIATTIFNLWQNSFLHRSIDDEIQALNSALPDKGVGFISSNGSTPGYRGIIKNLFSPEVTNVGQLLFDDIATPEQESPDEVMLLSLADAVAKAAEIFGTTDQNSWLWGKLHTITFEDLSGVAQFNIPAGDTEDENGFPTGFPRHGDKFGVDASDFSFSAGQGDLPGNRNDFAYSDGPVMRMVVEMIPGKIQAFNVLPAGQSASATSPHYDDQSKLWVENQASPMHFSTPDVRQYETSRIRLIPTKAIGQ